MPGSFVSGTASGNDLKKTSPGCQMQRFQLVMSPKALERR
jgi:hypothetical protein